jgi:omega-6 fatty acid desaturase (delta-12 desaturase)
VRTFIVMHECGHNVYTPSKTLNYLIGNLLGVLLFTPICWCWCHANHHLTSGNMENKLRHNYNELTYHTLRQYKQSPNYKQLIFRFFRHPCILFTIIPIIYFVIKQRFSLLLYKIRDNHRYPQSAVQILSESIFTTIGMCIYIHFARKYEIFAHLSLAMGISFSLGFMLFHNQHTFNPSYVTGNDEWTQRDSGIIGSSFIQFPYFLKYFTVGIEYHHVHHMNAKIPGYNLQAYHEEVVSKSDLFDNVVKLSMRDCYNNLWLALYDEDNKKYITMEEADN